MDPNSLLRRELLYIEKNRFLDIQSELVSPKLFAYTPQVSINLAL